MGLRNSMGGSGKPPEQIDVHTEAPLRLSGICRAFTMVCICPGAERTHHLYLPTHFNSSFNLLLWVIFLKFVCLEHLPGCWLLNCHQTMLTACDVEHEQGATEVRGLKLFLFREKFREWAAAHLISLFAFSASLVSVRSIT